MKKPIYKKWWFWVIIVAVVLWVIGTVTGDDIAQAEETKAEETRKEPSSKYIVVSVSQLAKELDANALNAKEKYDGEYVEITGRVSVIDADGRYISLEPTDNEWSLDSVMCYVKGKEQKEFVKTISTGDVVTLRGKITSVGEVLGYYLDIHEFVG